VPTRPTPATTQATAFQSAGFDELSGGRNLRLPAAGSGGDLVGGGDGGGGGVGDRGGGGGGGDGGTDEMVCGDEGRTSPWLSAMASPTTESVHSEGYFGQKPLSPKRSHAGMQGGAQRESMQHKPTSAKQEASVEEELIMAQDIVDSLRRACDSADGSADYSPSERHPSVEEGQNSPEDVDPYSLYASSLSDMAVDEFMGQLSPKRRRSNELEPQHGWGHMDNSGLALPAPAPQTTHEPADPYMMSTWREGAGYYPNPNPRAAPQRHPGQMGAAPPAGTQPHGHQSSLHPQELPQPTLPQTVHPSQREPQLLHDGRHDGSQRTSQHQQPPVMANGVMANGVNSVMANGAMPNSAMPNGVMPNGVMPNGVMPNGVMPNGVMPNSAMANSAMANGVNVSELKGSIMQQVRSLLDMSDGVQLRALHRSLHDQIIARRMVARQLCETDCLR